MEGAYFTDASMCGDPPRPDNGDVFVHGRVYRQQYRKQSCYDGYFIACDSGFFRRKMKFRQPPNQKRFIICTEDLDGSLFGDTSAQLVCVNSTDGIRNATYGIIWCLAGNWSPSIVCLPDTVDKVVTAAFISTATSNTVTTSADTCRPTATTTGVTGFSMEPQLTLFGGLTTSSNSGATSTSPGMSSATNAVTTSAATHSVPTSSTSGTKSSTLSITSDSTLSSREASSNRSQSYTVTAMISSTTEAPVTNVINTNTKSRNYSLTSTLSITSEASSSPTNISLTSGLVSKFTHNFNKKTHVVTTPSHGPTQTSSVQLRFAKGSSPKEPVITSPPVEETPQTAPNENTTATQKSQGHQDQLATHGDDKTSDGMIGYTILVSGIAGAAGIAVVLTLLIFVFKSLSGAAKVAPNCPNAELLEGSVNDVVVNGNL